MQLKSKDDNPISFGLPSGHAMVLGPEGAEVPQMLIQAAFAAGAVPAEAVVEEFIDAPEKTVGKTDQEAIQAAIKTMLERNAEGDFTDSGMPNRKALAKLVGLNVSAEDAAIAWQAVNDAL